MFVKENLWKRRWSWKKKHIEKNFPLYIIMELTIDDYLINSWCNYSSLRLASFIIQPCTYKGSSSFFTSVTSLFRDITRTEYIRLVRRQIMTSIVHEHFLGQREVAKNCCSITISPVKKGARVLQVDKKRIEQVYGRVFGREKSNTRSVERGEVPGGGNNEKPLFSRRVRQSLHRQLSTSDRPWIYARQ